MAKIGLRCGHLAILKIDQVELTCPQQYVFGIVVDMAEHLILVPGGIMKVRNSAPQQSVIEAAAYINIGRTINKLDNQPVFLTIIKHLGAAGKAKPVNPEFPLKSLGIAKALDYTVRIKANLVQADAGLSGLLQLSGKLTTLFFSQSGTISLLSA